MKFAVCLLTVLIAANPGVVKDLELTWLQRRAVGPGDELTLQVRLVFHREVCDYAPKKTSFYARGARILEKTEWKRIDECRFSRKIRLRLNREETQALVTALIQVHEQKTVSQLKIDIDR